MLNCGACAIVGSMKTEHHLIVGIHITDRIKHAGDVQNVLTRYGANIKTRIGLHDVTSEFSSPNGIILLELVGDNKHCLSILKALDGIKGVEAKKMVFRH